ncbi:DUF4834 family protein [Nonlabens sp.]|uniref:DUF4834 family protein n=1 Tax=Nonlabens sp. TaxID=1888209 RepID=UPI00326599A0
MEFLQTVLIILIVLVAVRLLWRAFGKTVLKWLGMKAMQRVQKSFEKRTGFNTGENPFQNQQAKSTKTTTSFKSNENKKVGEYIDFEEID